jgi:hypothetical protein
MPGIQSITDQTLLDAIDAATRRVVYVAPGIWPDLARSLVHAWSRLGSEGVSVILDIDAEVCRFGYGSIEGLKIIQGAAQMTGQAIGHEPGIRICIVIADEQTFIFSPTPRLIESTPGNPPVPGTTTPRANGIVLSSPPPSVEKGLGAGPDHHSDQTIGLEAVQPAEVEKVATDLKDNPPKTFDLARAVYVYNAAIQFAEFEVTGCRLSGHKAKLPTQLIKVVRKNPNIDDKIDKSLRLIAESDELVQNESGAISQVKIFEERKRIEDAYLVHVKGGTVIERSKKSAFEDEVKDLQALIQKFAAHVKEKLNDRYLATAKALAEELQFDVLDDLPPQWRRKLGSDPDMNDLKFLIKDALLKAFGDPERRISAMKAEVVFKDVTYDMLKDPTFVKTLSERLPGLAHLEEYTAAKETPAQGQFSLH